MEKTVSALQHVKNVDLRLFSVAVERAVFNFEVDTRLNRHPEKRERASRVTANTIKIKNKINENLVKKNSVV